MTSKRVLLIGAGAIGSALGELLVRGGVRDLTVIDSENATVGNLTRHTLTMDEAGNSKAMSVARLILVVC
jgi:tRNA A37 threonylcarbamoyladenosine dehydratase